MNWCALGLELSPESAPRPAPDRPRRRCCHRSAPADGLPAAAARAGRTAGDRCQGVFRGRRNARTYFVLECREIYDYSDSDMAAQNGKIIAQIVAIGGDLAKLYLPEPAGAEPFVRRTLRRLLKLPPPSPQEPYYEIGLGLRSNLLYYDFSPQQSAPPTPMWVA